MNIGTATRVLRDELPHFPQAGLTDYSIYAEDVAFTEPYRTHFHCHGRRWYKLLAATVHSALKMAFVDADFCVVGIQQRRGNQGAIDDAAKESKEDSHSDGGADDIQLVVRWIFEGTPRLSPSSPDAIRSVYEGVFVYVFDAEGLVKEHRLEAIHPSPPFVISWMAAAFGVPGRPPVATSSHLGMKYRDRS
ncbi:hypothetical protein PhCBS80983_g03335 [Powellomyces hirtus]|uniref:SnoaL-like domain-containing protein n=1 Tax=Powellomyces hirtus TaxID=109895 RepID=A0A507E4V1_9FUNG|nr:hypothetical protein PhCBS80983_g03335 [Powellomyces hirtus]